MNIWKMTIGFIVFGYGIFTLIVRIINPAQFRKLKALQMTMGKKTGMIIHIIGYTILPLIFGGVFMFAGIFGK
ncbi:MAG: hypothetical protein JXJ04_13190 [Spirochaetales bacterium]|nr:hypothetical protein [Spirochaetales bacterium]